MGNNTVSKMKTMFADIIKSQVTVQEFKDTKLSGNSFVNEIEFRAEILTSGHWPFQDMPVCNIPPQLSSIQTIFSQFYVNKFANRKIMWVYNHGSLTLETTYLPDKKYVLEVNVFQEAVLNLFNEYDELTVKECKEKT